MYAEWLGVVCQRDVKFSTVDRLDVSVQDGWELAPDIEDRNGWLALVMALHGVTAGDGLGLYFGRMVNSLAAFQDSNVPVTLG